MAIKSSTFGGVHLTGNAAKVFRKQFLGIKNKANSAAQVSLERGRLILKQLKKRGFAVIKSPTT